MSTKTKTETPTREMLLELCERALSVPQSSWSNRDSSAATRQLGEAYALLRAGCEFDVRRDGRTYWVRITYHGFDYFEGSYDGPGFPDDERFYVPTAERLDESAGRDWY